jgi:hypothetical protein
MSDPIDEFPKLRAELTRRSLTQCEAIAAGDDNATKTFAAIARTPETRSVALDILKFAGLAYNLPDGSFGFANHPACDIFNSGKNNG